MAAVTLFRDATVATIVLHRPECRNAVDGPTAAELRDAFEAFQADPGLRVAVFTGGGGQFCAGADGCALAEAQVLARRITAFPQRCLQADRASAFAQWDLPLAEALRHEGAGGHPVIEAESLAGAARFAGGAGRHGRPV
jgi:enoyl-CoA hydratase/carnithine racemase